MERDHNQSCIVRLETSESRETRNLSKMVSSCWGNRCICFISTSQAASSFYLKLFHCLGSSLAPCPADDHGVHGYPGASSLGQGLSPHTCASSEDIHVQGLPVSSKYKDNKPSLKNESILRIKGICQKPRFLLLSEYPPLWALELQFLQIVFITVLSIVLSHSFYHILQRPLRNLFHFSGILR